MRNYRLNAMERGVKRQVIGWGVEGGREVEFVKGEDERKKGRWFTRLQWPVLKKRAVPQLKTLELRT
jgi:hypothetical protein